MTNNRNGMKAIATMNDHPKGLLEVFEDDFEEYRVYANGFDVTEQIVGINNTPADFLEKAADLWDEGMLRLR
ncbi:hypothetical protein [Deinococcus seoulensis]|nr:hypothetical protein [Deinococcus seoulensis]